MNILIADSGASKTDWVLLSENQSQFVQTEGLNPHLVTAAEFMNVLSKELKPNLNGKAIGEIYFYGSGCGSSEKKKEVEGYLSEIFEFAEVNVRTDIEGAGLALFENREGIVCILGTGSSAGFFCNGEISDQMPSVGYPHGDEGSASYIGKELLKAYLKDKMHKDLRIHLEQNINMDLDDLFVKLQNPKDAKLLVARVCKVMSKKSYHSQIQSIIYDGFSKFLEKVKEHFPEQAKKLPFGFVGGTASAYEAELRACAKQMEIEISSVIRAPIEHIAFHFSK